MEGSNVPMSLSYLLLNVFRYKLMLNHRILCFNKSAGGDKMFLSPDEWKHS
jgi:hypothetical protein